MSIDSLLLVPIALALYLLVFYNSEYSIFRPPPLGGGHWLANSLLQLGVPALLTVLFWVRCGATPGKMALGVRVVDVHTGRPISGKQATIRYLCYILSFLPLCLGFLWVAWDPKKQAWHDKLANTVVVYSASGLEATFPANE